MEHRISVLILSIILFVACSDEPACLKPAGDPVSFNIEVQPFNHVELNDAIELELVQSNDTLIAISTRENLKSHLSFEVKEGKLIIKDQNSCNWLREYNNTKITIHHPQLHRIDHLGSNKIYSRDTIYYEDLTLYCKNAPGDFEMILNNNKTVISIDDLNNITLSGKCSDLFVGIYAGDGRVDAKNLNSERTGFFQRGSNDIMVYPKGLLYGKIIGYGNVIYYNKPEKTEVEDTGKGELIPKF